MIPPQCSGSLRGVFNPPGSVTCMLRAALLLATLAATVLGLMEAVEAAEVSDPACAAADLAPAIALPALARVMAEGRVVQVLAIGSSSTAGAGASEPAKSYPAQLQRRLAMSWGAKAVHVENAGINGEKGPETFERLKAALAGAQKPDIVLWQVGTNDANAGTDPAELKALVARGVDMIRAAGAAPVLVNQQFFPGIGDVARYERYVAAVDGAARDKDVPVLPRYAIMKQWASDGGTLLGDMLSADRFHMNDRGYGCLADLAAAALTRNAPARAVSSLAVR